MITTTTATMEADVRAFARTYPTANVLRMITLCEAGRITWAEAYTLAQQSLAKGLASVQSEEHRALREYCPKCGDVYAYCPDARPWAAKYRVA